MNAYENNLVAKLLEDRAAQCSRNEYICREDLNAPYIAEHWREQKDIASNLAISFREAGKQ